MYRFPKRKTPWQLHLRQPSLSLRKKRQQENNRNLKQFAEEPKLSVLNGRYGPYIAYDGTNYRLPKALHERAAELTLEECYEGGQYNNKKEIR